MDLNGNRHHILFYDEDWQARPELERFYNERWLQIGLREDIHEDLHQSVPFVPALSERIARTADKFFVPVYGNVVMTIAGFRWAIDDAMKATMPHYWEKQAAELTMDALSAQVPFIMKQRDYGQI